MVAQAHRLAGTELGIDQINLVMADPFGQLRERMAALADLRNVAQLLDWDQQTMMPPRGAAGRAEEMATLGRVIHERFTAPEIGRLLDELADFEQQQPHDSFEASLIRVTRVDFARSMPGLRNSNSVQSSPR